MNHSVEFKWNRLAFLVAMLACTLVVSVSSATAQYFTIDDYRSDIVIQADGTILVTETLDLTFDRARHGIYREIPYRYRTELGKRLIMPIDVKSVKDQSGRNWKYRVSHQGNVINIRIGDADKYVDGRQVYVITYTVRNALLFLKDHDELYWNVTGNAWKAPITHASATVKLETQQKSKLLQASCYTGTYGSNQSDCEHSLTDNGATFVCNTSLHPGQGFTIALGFDKGLVAAPGAWQKFLWAINFRENWVFVFPVFALFFMFFRWYTRGRDPRVREAVTVMYEPPKFDGKPLNSAEVGTLIDETLDTRDITSTIVGLAEKGYIKIMEIKDEGVISLFDRVDYNLTKLKPAGDDLSPYERLMLNDIFTGDDKTILVSEMKNKFYRHLPALKSTLYSDLVEKKYFPVSPESVRNAYIAGGVIAAAVVFIITITIVPDSVLKNVLAALFTGIVVAAFSPAMPVRTRAGALGRMHVLGFQEFMNRADKDRLERMGKDIFYKYLAYAIALDVVDHWSKAFEGIYKEPPSWYVPIGGYAVFSPVTFSRNLTTATSSLGSAMFSAPRGSGSGGASGGGGFSGGGGGGGGGGSW